MELSGTNFRTIVNLINHTYTTTYTLIVYIYIKCPNIKSAWTTITVGQLNIIQ